MILGRATLVLDPREYADGEVDLAIRPEAIALVAAGAAAIRGTVRKAVYVGGSVEYTIDSDVGELFAISLDVASTTPVGAEVGVALADHGVVVIPRDPGRTQGP